MTRWWRGASLVCGRELTVGSARRSYRITAVVMLLLGVAAAVAPRVISSSSEQSYDLAVVGTPPPGFEPAIETVADSLDVTVTTNAVATREKAEQLVRDDEVDAAIIWFAGAATGTDERVPALLARSFSADELVAVVSSAAVSSSTVVRLEAAGVSAADAGSVLASPPQPETIDTPNESPRAAIGFVVVFVLYLFLVTAGTQVATGVAVEKTNRIAESLLATLRSSQLLGGKVIGVGLLAIAPLMLAGVPVVISFVVGGDFEVPEGAVGDVVAGFGWFALGFALYACAYAALGALVDRQEEVSGAVTPLTFVLVATFLLATQAQVSPDSTLAVVSSIFPLSAPMVMPMRIAAGDPPTAQVVVAVVGVVATAALIVRAGSVVYRRALVRTGRRLKLREVVRG